MLVRAGKTQNLIRDDLLGKGLNWHRDGLRIDKYFESNLT
jgi:hypothetical protein